MRSVLVQPLVVFVIVAAGILAFALFSSYIPADTTPSGTATPPPPAHPAAHNPVAQIVKSASLPASLAFANEEVPLHNWDVRERLDRELNVNVYYHSSTLFCLKLARRYFPIIEPILARHGIPDDFKYMAVAESGLINAVSSVGAKGIWQFMDDTAPAFGMEVSSEIDERYHIEKATEGACRYLQQAYSKFGNWTLAAASYNAGMSRIATAKEKQKESSYYNMELNTETSRYIFRILALKVLLQTPADYGFLLENDEYYTSFPDFYTVEVNTPITSWADFAHERGTTYRMLKIYNPWLRDTELKNPKKQTYLVKIPR